MTSRQLGGLPLHVEPFANLGPSSGALDAGPIEVGGAPHCGSAQHLGDGVTTRGAVHCEPWTALRMKSSSSREKEKASIYRT